MNYVAHANEITKTILEKKKKKKENYENIRTDEILCKFTRIEGIGNDCIQELRYINKTFIFIFFFSRKSEIDILYCFLFVWENNIRPVTERIVHCVRLV